MIVEKNNVPVVLFENINIDFENNNNMIPPWIVFVGFNFNTSTRVHMNMIQQSCHDEYCSTALLYCTQASVRFVWQTRGPGEYNHNYKFLQVSQFFYKITKMWKEA